MNKEKIIVEEQEKTARNNEFIHDLERCRTRPEEDEIYREWNEWRNSHWTDEEAERDAARVKAKSAKLNY